MKKMPKNHQKRAISPGVEWIGPPKRGPDPPKGVVFPRKALEELPKGGQNPRGGSKRGAKRGE